MERPFVGIAESAERREVFFGEVLAVVGECEDAGINAHGCVCRTGIVCILKQLGEDVAGTLNLLEELMPWTGKFWIRLQLAPTFFRALTDAIKVFWFRCQLGFSARSSNSAKS